MRDACYWPFARQYQRIELDEAVPLALIVGTDPRPHCQLVANAGQPYILHRAADMYPRAEQHIVTQCPIAGAQHHTGCAIPSCA